MKIDNFKISKNKWYIVTVDRKNLHHRHVEARTNTKVQAVDLANQLDCADLKLFGDFITNRYIVKGVDVACWFYKLNEA